MSSHLPVDKDEAVELLLSGRNNMIKLFSETFKLFLLHCLAFGIDRSSAYENGKLDFEWPKIKFKFRT